jgi:hypothetical protein
MNDTKLAETLLLQLEIFSLLQFLDGGVEERDVHVLKTISTYYQRTRPGLDWQNSVIFPLVRRGTSLSILVLPFAFTSRLTDAECQTYGLVIRPEHDLEYRHGDIPETAPSAEQVLRVVRNAVAHLPDNIMEPGKGQPNVTFDNLHGAEGIICFRSRANQVIFHTEAGYVAFLNMFASGVRRAIQGKLLPRLAE